MQKIESLRLLVTSRCPYKCSYCHKEGMKSFVPELLDVSDYEYFLKLLKKNFKLREVTLTGGDPFCRKDIWKITRFIKKLKISSVIVTKGMLIKKIFLVDQITFTIDALDGGTYSEICGVNRRFLDRTIDKMIKAKFKGIRVVVNTPISIGVNDDKENFEKLLSFCKKYKVDEWKLIEVLSIGKKVSQKKFYLENYARRMGIKIGKLRGCKLELKHHGVPITLYRCHCHVVELTKKYIPESLFLDPAGSILLCMRNKAKINLLQYIKNREDHHIIKALRDINFGKICPIIKSK